MELSNRILSDITVFTKYSKYIPSESRRESWSEVWNRNMMMHIDNFPRLADEIESVYTNYVAPKLVLPSMRSLQFGGKPINLAPNRIYNCSFAPVDDYRVFSETMFLLLGGSGVGYSVQKHYISNLPTIKKPRERRRVLIADSIEGWADAVKYLMKSYFFGTSAIDFDFSDIRAKGTVLKTTGGKAPGAEPLKRCLFNVRTILERKKEGERLTSCEASDIMCHIADAVLAGGIRRASLIALFDHDDYGMLTYKSGNWWELNPQRARVNVSTVLYRPVTTYDDFMERWEIIRNSGSGEPGIYFSNNPYMGTNPCFTGDTIIAVADGRNGVTIKELADSNTKFLVYSGRKSFVYNQTGNTGRFRKWIPEIKSAVAFKTGTKKVISIILSDGSSFRCTPDHLLATKDGRWVEAKDSVGECLGKFFSFSNKNSRKNYRHINSISDGSSRQYSILFDYFNPDKNRTGMEINHIDSDATNDNYNNLELISIEEHRSKTNRIGLNNPIHRAEYTDRYKFLLSLTTTVNNYKRAGKTEEEIEKLIYEKYGDYEIPEVEDKNIYMNEDVYVELIVDNNEIEDVYDLTVEDNHNFYIITKWDDDKFLNSSGVLVHNCAEIGLLGNQFCNVDEINGSNIIDQRDFMERVYASAFLGTLQASYTDFHYLRPIWKEVTEREALLGIGITGIADGRVHNLNLREGALYALKVNEDVARKIGVNKAARVTTVKPAGTSSMVLGSSSGAHTRYGKFYLRRMRVNKSEPIYSYMEKIMPELIEDDMENPKEKGILVFPQKAPKDAITRDQETSLQFLDRVKHLYNEWILPGHRSGDNTHNVSATVYVKDDEWDLVGSWMWENRSSYNGLSVLPYDGGNYKQAPFEEITEEEYNKLLPFLKSINLKEVKESDDLTSHLEQVACAGSACEVEYLTDAKAINKYVKIDKEESMLENKD